MNLPARQGPAPRWVRIADALTVGCGVAALVIAVTGGFRIAFGPETLSVRSPLRLLAAAAALALIRHAVVFRPSLPGRVIHGARAWFARTNPAFRETAVAAAAMAVLTVIVLWPQVRGLTLLPDHGDPLFSIWRLSWVAHQLPRDPIHLYDANIYWPERNTLANSDGMPLSGVVAAPLLWAGVPAVIVYNLFMLASFVLCGVTMFVLARRLTGDRLASGIAAVAFAFYPWRFEHYVHFELQSAFWMPLALIALHRVIETPRSWGQGAWLGLFVAAQYLSSMYFGVFLATMLGVIGVVLFVLKRDRAFPIRPVVLAGLVMALLTAPTVPPYLGVRDATGGRTMEEVDAFSARPIDYVSVKQPNKRYDEVNERQVFPGLALMVLAALALLPGVSRVRWAYLAGLIVAFDISLGSYGVLHPFLFKWLLPYQGLRVPARFAMLVGCALSVLAALGTARVLRWFSRPAVRTLVAAGASLLLLVEVWPAIELKPVAPIHPVYRFFIDRPDARLAKLPMWYPAGPRYLLYSTSHWRPMVNGFSGSVPQSYREIHVAMRDFPDERSMAMLRERGVTHLVVHEEYLGAEGYRALIDRMEQTPGLTYATLATDGQYEARVYVLD